MRTCPTCGRTMEESLFPTVNDYWHQVSAAGSAWHRSCIGCHRRHDRIARELHARYGMVLHAQGGLCKACGGPPYFPGERFRFDIDHRVWLFRGLLHPRCNTILGMLDDDPTKLRALADYLEHCFDGRVIPVQPRLPGFAESALDDLAGMVEP